MKKKYIKKAEIEFYQNMDEDAIEIECDIDFAISLHREDMIWIEEEKPKQYPYLKATPEQLNELADGWYVVISRTIIFGNILKIEMEEAHENSYFKKKFQHLSMFTR